MTMLPILLKQAFQSILGSPIRSLLTILGVVIGISSIILFQAVGEGLRQDVRDEIAQLGSNLLFVVPGEYGEGGLASFNTNLLSGDILKPEDLTALDEVPGIQAVSALSIVGGVVRRADQVAPQAILTGARANLPEILTTISVSSGRFFTATEEAEKVHAVVLGDAVAQSLFGDNDPIDQTLEIGKTSFTVFGVLKGPEGASLFGGSDYSQMVILPLETSGELTNGVKIMRILVALDPDLNPTEQIPALEAKLLERHAAEDFSILTQDDIVGLLDKILTLLTAAISAIAAISLVVAGVGIMNIMLVTVTERTREIGLRKAIGATNAAILTQFLIEALMLTLVGAVIAIGLALLVSALAAKYSPLDPVVTPAAMLLAVSVAVAVGIIFGLAPAIRAARLDPIKALRYE